jgi:hypothetical protein
MTFHDCFYPPILLIVTYYTISLIHDKKDHYVGVVFLHCPIEDYLEARFSIISWATFGGTSSYCASSMVEAARPWLIERMSPV